MSNYLKNWWCDRKARHYLKNNWHLFADIFLLLIVLILIINLIIIKKSSNIIVNTDKIKHTAISVATSTEALLLIKSSSEINNIYSGQEVVIHLNLKNEGLQDISNLVLKLVSGSDKIIIGSLSADNPVVKINDDEMVLDKISSGENIKFDFKFIITAKKDSPRSVPLLLKNSYYYNNFKYSNNHTIKTFKLISDLKIKAAAYYNSQFGDQLGSGPIPPIVGLPTNYWVFFEINDNQNELNNLTISAKLSDSVSLLKGKTVSAGDFSYDESQKRITWVVKKISVDDARYQVGFELQLLPTKKQVGLKPILVSNISYMVTDAYTGEKITGKLPSIDTSLPLDSINEGQGVVAE